MWHLIKIKKKTEENQKRADKLKEKRTSFCRLDGVFVSNQRIGNCSHTSNANTSRTDTDTSVRGSPYRQLGDM